MSARARRRTLVAALLFAPMLLGATAAPAAAQQRGEQAWQITPEPQSSIVLAGDGSIIGDVGKEIRTSVPLATLPSYLPNAFIAVEDQRFWQHDGVDVVGIAGAIKDNILGERRGASTIDQQLVGNLHPTIIDRRDKSLGRKLREQAAAREMERHYTKQQILEAYLNDISFGHGWFGVEAAARHYFGKSASQLSIAEAATLAALPKGPAVYDPIRHPDRAVARRNTVLALMADQGYITHAQATAAQREPLVTVPNGGMSAPAEYFVDAVAREAARAGIPVASGGYRIFTTLDPSLQRDAVASLAEETAEIEARPGFGHPTLARHPKGKPDYLQGAVVVLDPTTGEVRALVGGRDYAESQYDRAIDALRQPGSSFKPIVYATAVADSIPPNALLGDTAISIPLPDGSVYQPQDDDGQYLGPITMREALVKSRNIVAVAVAQRVGMDSVIALARRLGIDTPISPYPATAIGASAVHPIDLVAAYTAFANLGAVVQPRLIRKITDRDGRTVWSPPAQAPTLAMDPLVAFIVRNMMRDVVERGTATAVRRFLPESIPVAGKTGTTNDNTDVWFVGMTPDLVAGVWLGFDTPQPIGTGAFGGSMAAPVWARMMARWYQGRTAAQWTPPSGLVVAELDRATGQPATDSTPPEQRYTEYFLPGTQPASLRADPWSLFRRGPIVLF